MKASSLALVLLCAMGVAMARSPPPPSGEPSGAACRLERLATSWQQMNVAREQLKAGTLQRLAPVLTPAQLKNFEVLMRIEKRDPTLV